MRLFVKDTDQFFRMSPVHVDQKLVGMLRLDEPRFNRPGGEMPQIEGHNDSRIGVDRASENVVISGVVLHLWYEWFVS